MIITLIAIIAVVIVFLAAFSGRLFAVAQVRNAKIKSSKYIEEDINRKELIEEEKSWFLSQNPETVTIQSKDGLTLAGYYLENPGSDSTIALFHGYHSDGFRDFAPVLRFYSDMGMNILLVSQRAHADSEGKYIGFGILEMDDCRRWIDYINQYHKPESIFLSGISMGSTTVLMASGKNPPGNIRGIIADCGFTSPHDELSHVFSQYFKMPSVPFIYITSAFSKIFAGYGYKNYSTLDAMADNNIPVLFIHGERDNFVPTRMSYENYEACKAEKELYIVENAGHAKSLLTEREKYCETVSGFIGKYTHQSPAIAPHP